jgi:predicted nucleotidyltransferase
MSKSGTKSKKIVFYDTIERHAELKLRLQHDSISQAIFFRSLVTGYIKKDSDILNFVDKIKASKKTGARVSKKEIKESRELINEGREIVNRLGLGEDEIEDIFDLLERSNPDL